MKLTRQMTPQYLLGRRKAGSSFHATTRKRIKGVAPAWKIDEAWPGSSSASAPRGSRESGRESTRRPAQFSAVMISFKDLVHALARHCVGVGSKRPSLVHIAPIKPCDRHDAARDEICEA